MSLRQGCDRWSRASRASRRGRPPGRRRHVPVGSVRCSASSLARARQVRGHWAAVACGPTHLAHMQCRRGATSGWASSRPIAVSEGQSGQSVLCTCGEMTHPPNDRPWRKSALAWPRSATLETFEVPRAAANGRLACMRRSALRDLGAVVGPPTAAAFVGNAFIGNAAMPWFRVLRTPGMQVPCPLFVAVGGSTISSSAPFCTGQRQRRGPQSSTDTAGAGRQRVVESCVLRSTQCALLLH